MGLQNPNESLDEDVTNGLKTLKIASRVSSTSESLPGTPTTTAPQDEHALKKASLLEFLALDDDEDWANELPDGWEDTTMSTPVPEEPTSRLSAKDKRSKSRKNPSQQQKQQHQSHNQHHQHDSQQLYNAKIRKNHKESNHTLEKVKSPSKMGKKMTDQNKNNGKNKEKDKDKDRKAGNGLSGEAMRLMPVLGWTPEPKTETDDEEPHQNEWVDISDEEVTQLATPPSSAGADIKSGDKPRINFHSHNKNDRKQSNIDTNPVEIHRIHYSDDITQQKQVSQQATIAVTTNVKKKGLQQSRWADVEEPENKIEIGIKPMRTKGNIPTTSTKIEFKPDVSEKSGNNKPVAKLKSKWADAESESEPEPHSAVASTQTKASKPWAERYERKKFETERERQREQFRQAKINNKSLDWDNDRAGKTVSGTRSNKQMPANSRLQHEHFTFENGSTDTNRYNQPGQEQEWW